jgi:hypothetical protein
MEVKETCQKRPIIEAKETCKKDAHTALITLIAPTSALKEMNHRPRWEARNEREGTYI